MSRLFALLIACVAWHAASPSQAADTPLPAARPPVVLAADKWCPVNCSAVEGPPGFAVEFAREAFALAGRQVEYRVMPWERAIESARAGRIDGIIGTTRENTPDFVFPREPAGRNANVFFTRPDATWRFRGVRSLEKVVVGVANQYLFGGPFDTYVNRYRNDTSRVTVLYSQDPVPQALRMLQAARIDAYVDDRMVVAWERKQDPSLGAVREAGTLSEPEFHVAFSPARATSRALADEWDRGIRRLRAEGRLAAILARYGLGTPEPDGVSR